MFGRGVRAAAGVAMVSGARRNRAERQAIEQQTQAQQAQPSSPPAQSPPAATPSSELTQQLEELNNLKNQGVITPEEFAAKKKQLLNL